MDLVRHGNPGHTCFGGAPTGPVCGPACRRNVSLPGPSAGPDEAENGITKRFFNRARSSAGLSGALSGGLPGGQRACDGAARAQARDRSRPPPGRAVCRGPEGFRQYHRINWPSSCGPPTRSTRSTRSSRSTRSHPAWRPTRQCPLPRRGAARPPSVESGPAARRSPFRRASRSRRPTGLAPCRPSDWRARPGWPFPGRRSTTSAAHRCSRWPSG